MWITIRDINSDIFKWNSHEDILPQWIIPEMFDIFYSSVQWIIPEMFDIFYSSVQWIIPEMFDIFYSSVQWKIPEMLAIFEQCSVQTLQGYILHHTAFRRLE